MKLYFYSILLLASTSIYAMKPSDAYKPTTEAEIIKELDRSDAFGFQYSFDLAQDNVRDGDTKGFIDKLKKQNDEMLKKRTKEVDDFEIFYKVEKDKSHDWKGFKKPIAEFSVGGILLAISSKLYTNFNKHITPKNIIDKIFQPLTSSKLSTMVTFGVCVASAVVLFNKALQSAKPSWYYQDTLNQQRSSIIQKRDAHVAINNFLSVEKIINEWKNKQTVGYKAYTPAGIEILPLPL